MTNKQKLLILFVLSTMLYVLWHTATYWYADTLYAKAKNFNAINNPKEAEKILKSAIEISPNEPYYHLELSESYTRLGKPEEAISESKKASHLSPSNVNIKRSAFTTFIRLSNIDKKYILDALKTLEEAIQIAPTDAKLFYNLGLAYVRVGQIDQAVKILQKTIEMKPNYKDARLAYSFILIDKKEYNRAKEQLEYILKNIDPNDEMARQTLEEIE